MNIEPFGSNNTQATLDLGVQKFLGLTVVDFQCNSSWTPEGGQCTIKLVQDDGEYLQNVIVGSPQYFEIVTTTQVPLFRFYGILLSIARDADPSSKIYTAVLQSPTVLLDACTIITDGFAGKGGAYEAYGPNIPACLDYGNLNSVTNTDNVYNVLNPFGVYENESYGFASAGFGKSIVNGDGMRIDLFVNAIHELVHGNPTITPALGSNILYGASAYTNSKAYAYNFNIKGFLSQISSFIPSDYRVSSRTLMDFVSEICELINHIYYIDLLKPPGFGKPAFATGHTSTQLPILTHAGTTYGGEIIVVTQNRNNTSSTKFPLSRAILAGNSFLASKGEKSDKLGGVGQTQDLPLDIGMIGQYHPDGPPVGSPHAGNSFPVESINEDNVIRYTNTNISVRLNSGAVGARYVVGGYQSRINYIATYGINNNKNPEFVGQSCDPSRPTPDLDTTADVYQYWGDINISARIGSEVPNVPVITPLYSPLDFIMIDCYDLFGDFTINGVGTPPYPNPINRGIYFASELEITCAMTSYELWLECLSFNKNNKLQAFKKHFTNLFFPKAPIFDLKGNPTFFGRSLMQNASTLIHEYNTSAKDSEEIKNVNSANASFAANTLFLKKLYERISSIGDEHYGKTYAVKVPAYNVRQDVNDEAPLNQYVKSWDLADDAYLEPSNYVYYEAPLSGFVNNGRLKAHANYILNQTPSLIPYPGTNVPVIQNATSYTVLSNPDMSAPASFGFSPSFEAYSKEEVYIRRNGLNRDLVSVPLSVEKEYVLVPSAYFTFYEMTSSIPSAAANNPNKHYSLSQSKANQIVSFISSLSIPFNGFGCVPFAIVETKGVFSTVKLKHPIDDIPQPDDGDGNKGLNKKKPNERNVKKAIHPRSFAIPQQSNRFRYGPWLTETNLPYGIKIEYIEDTNLVPENFLIPTSVNIGGVLVSSNAGYESMYTAGQLIANTVENFDFLFTEEGSVTIPGYPIITHLGQSLVAGGPLVSDISINISAGNISTEYGMKTFAPKFGKATDYVMKKLSSLSRMYNNGK